MSRFHQEEKEHKIRCFSAVLFKSILGADLRDVSNIKGFHNNEFFRNIQNWEEKKKKTKKIYM